MFKKFLKQLAHDVYWNEGDSDHPTCPSCGHKMKFYGHDENGDFEYGEGYWECKACGYTVSEDDISDIDPGDPF